MPIIERDPWRQQYFDKVECPPELLIPTDDEMTSMPTNCIPSTAGSTTSC
jgi:hypothetical protein